MSGTAEEITQLRAQLAEREADVARLGEAMRHERRRRLQAVGAFARVRRAVENHGDRAAIVAMRTTIYATPSEIASFASYLTDDQVDRAIASASGYVGNYTIASEAREQARRLFDAMAAEMGADQ